MLVLLVNLMDAGFVTEENNDFLFFKFRSSDESILEQKFFKSILTLHFYSINKHYKHISYFN